MRIRSRILPVRGSSCTCTRLNKLQQRKVCPDMRPERLSSRYQELRSWVPAEHQLTPNGHEKANKDAGGIVLRRQEKHPPREGQALHEHQALPPEEERLVLRVEEPCCSDHPGLLLLAQILADRKKHEHVQ